MTPDFESLPGIPAGTPVSGTDCDPRYALNSERRILLVIHRDDCARYAFRRAQAFDPA